MRRRGRFAAVAVVTIAALGAGGIAAPKPMVLAATYDDSVASELKVPKDAKPCTLEIASLVDERRTPEMVGVYFGRAIHAPENRDAWLRSMIQALKSRKIAIGFSGDSNAVPITIAMTKAWISNTESNMSASIVFRMKLTDSSGTAVEQNFRGGASHMSYWSGGPGELQRAFDTSVSRALDALAANLHRFCGNMVSDPS